MTESLHVLDGQPTLREIINDVIRSGHEEDAFYVFDADDIIQKYNMWSTIMPRVKPHYAVKCNDHPMVLKILAALGIGFDCASKGEIQKVLSLGVCPSRIIYAHTTKPPTHLKHAAKVGVDLMTFDNELELHKIKKLYPDARLVIRIKYDAKLADVVLGRKFGCDPNTEAYPLLKVARSLGLNVVGVSFHVGSGCHDPSAFYGAIACARHVFNVGSEIGFNFTLLDVGGGYPGEMDNSINEYGDIINSALEKYFPDDTVHVMSEPGTFFVGSAFTLVANIHSAKQITEEDPATGRISSKYMYYINDGVYGNLNCIISYHILKFPEPLKAHTGKKYPSTIWGPTCDSLDQVLADVLLPELQLGEWLVFRDMGGYTLCLFTQFNGFEPPVVYSTISRRNWSILKLLRPFQNKKLHAEDLSPWEMKQSQDNEFSISRCSNVNF